jgi:flagellar protein FlaI
MAIRDALPGGADDPGEQTPGESADPETAADSEAADETEIAVGEYTWEDYKTEYYYDEEGEPPRDDEGEVIEFDASDALGFDSDSLAGRLSFGESAGDALDDVVEERSVDVSPDLDEDAFFSTVEGHTTVANRYDLEKAVPLAKKSHFREIDRYWVNKPHAFVVIFHSEKENENKYYAIEPYFNEIERDLREFLSRKLKTAIKYSDDDIIVDGGEESRGDVIERETIRLLERYDLFEGDTSQLTEATEDEDEAGDGLVARIKELFDVEQEHVEHSGQLDGIAARPERALVEEDSPTFNEYQVEKFFYMMNRDFVGFERIDPIKHDINIEDVSCDGYHSPVFVYHTDHEQVISNVFHGEGELDDFVVKMAQRSGKGISKRQPQVDCTLPDGSRAQLTLGREVSDHGTNYTIRQFKDVPFTPIDLINWNTFSLDEMAYLWLCIENNKSLIFAGGTASGKTTSLNAVSLFIPSKSKIVSIEDTREVELPQRNWIASVTRPSFSEDGKGDVDEFDLLEAALRQRPEYIVMGEIRGEEGRTLFQVMSTGHTTLTTFHADSVGEVIKRFTTEPINVSKTMFSALDLVSIQTSTRVDGHKVRRNKSLTEINRYDAENDEINVQDVYQWQAESDEFMEMGESNTIEQIKFDRGWDRAKLDREMLKRKVVLAYLIRNNLNTYTQVAASLQAFINDPETILTLIADDDLERSLEDLREMESVEIDIDPKKEEMVPRPDPGEEILAEAEGALADAAEFIDGYRDGEAGGLVDALPDADGSDGKFEAEEDDGFGGFRPKGGGE